MKLVEILSIPSATDFWKEVNGSLEQQEIEIIKRSFLLATFICRSHGTFNPELHELFFKLGIHSGLAQAMVADYFQKELGMQQRGSVPSVWDIENFATQCAFKFKGSIESALIQRGVIKSFFEAQKKTKKEVQGENEIASQQNEGHENKRRLRKKRNEKSVRAQKSEENEIKLIAKA